MQSRLGIRLIKIAAVYMMIGLGMGLFMAIGQDHTLSTVHSHLTLMGWMTMGITGLIYRGWTELENRALAHWHFWLHNVGLPVMMVGLGIKEYGHPAVEPVIGIGSMIVLVGLLLFTINLFREPGSVRQG